MNSICELPGATGSPSALLLDWYDEHGRSLPWRIRGGRTKGGLAGDELQMADPYRVWLSEIMLQQTTVATVIPYYTEFLDRWPTVVALADAPLEDVLHGWQGLGYYARARNLHKCARLVAGELAGKFPDSEAALRQLPGIGVYTAAAIAAIAFGRRAVVVDGNVERVMARIFAVDKPLPDSKGDLRDHADSLTPDHRSGDYAQAVMDLGATVCTVRSPRCTECPWAEVCNARQQSIAESLPRRTPKVARPTRRGIVFWVEHSGLPNPLQTDQGALVLLRRRAEKGMLGGMAEFPATPWDDGQLGLQEWTVENSADYAPPQVPSNADWNLLPGQIRHSFTHYHLELRVAVARLQGQPLAPLAVDEGYWWPVSQLDEQALPTLMKKVARLVGA